MVVTVDEVIHWYRCYAGNGRGALVA